MLQGNIKHFYSCSRSKSSLRGKALPPTLVFRSIKGLSKGYSFSSLCCNLYSTAFRAVFPVKLALPCLLCGEGAAPLHQHCNDRGLLGHSPAALLLFLEVVSETVGICFRAEICSQGLVCHLNCFSTVVPFGVIKELMCSERRHKFIYS